MKKTKNRKFRSTSGKLNMCTNMVKKITVYAQLPLVPINKIGFSFIVGLISGPASGRPISG